MDPGEAARSGQARGGESTVLFGSADIGILADGRALFPGVGYLGTSPLLATVNEIEIEYPCAIRGFAVTQPGGAAGGAVALTYDLRLNGTIVASLVLDIAAGGGRTVLTQAQWVNVVALQRLRLEVTKAGALVTSPRIACAVHIGPRTGPPRGP